MTVMMEDLCKCVFLSLLEASQDFPQPSRLTHSGYRERDRAWLAYRRAKQEASERKTSSSSLPRDTNTGIQRRPDTEANALDTTGKEQEIKLRIAFWPADGLR